VEIQVEADPQHAACRALRKLEEIEIKGEHRMSKERRGNRLA